MLRPRMILLPSQFKELLDESRLLVLALAVLTGFFLSLGMLFLGAPRMVEIFYPISFYLSSTAWGVFVFLLLPLSFSPRWRPGIALITLITGHSVGIAVWLVAGVFIMHVFGWFAALLMFWFPLTAPAAMLALFRIEEWGYAFFLMVFALTSLCLNIYAAWLERLMAYEDV